MTTLDYNHTESEARRASEKLRRKMYAAAFSHLRLAAAIDSAIRRDAEALEARFFYMLRFLASDNEVGDLDSTLADITEAFGTLVRRIELAIEKGRGTSTLGTALRFASLRPEETLASLVSDYIAELDRLRTDASALTDTGRRSTIERTAADIFTRVWIEFPLQADSAALLSDVLLDAGIPLHDRVLWTNALGLDMLAYPTRSVTDLLLKMHADADAALSVAAAVWLTLAVSHASAEGDMTAAEAARIMQGMTEHHSDDLALIVLEWCRSLGTEKMSESMKGLMQDNIRKLGQQFSERFKNIDPEKYDELLMNSDWIPADAGPGTYDSIKQFAEAQQRGDDVFMSTIGKMRHFDFFNTMANWFLPFHTGHSSLAPIVDGEGAAVADTIAQMPMLCDSDKYALVLSMAQAPEQMRSTTMAAMSQQMLAVSSTEEFSEMMQAMAKTPRRALINNCIKNIYRFFRLYRAAGEFADTLRQEPDQVIYTYIWENGRAQLKEIADTLFTAKRYEAAAELYSALEGDDALSRIQKYAFAAEMSGDNTTAIELYAQIASSEASDPWAALRLASIYLNMGEPKAAVDVLEPYADAQSGNAEFLWTLASAYIAADMWDDAVKVYHNIDYILPDDDRSAAADLGWALTVSGDYEAAYEVLSGIPGTPLVNRRASVLMWLSGKHEAAVRLREKADNDAGKSGSAAIDDPLFQKGVDAIKSKTARAASLPMLDEIIRYRRYGSDFGNILD